MVQPGQGEYFSTVATYIHLNPVRVRLLDFKAKDLSAYSWSSYPLYFDRAKRPEWNCVNRVLGAFQWQDDRGGLAKFGRMMLRRKLEVYCSEHPMEFDASWKAIRRGWCLGDDDVRSEMEGLVDKRINQYDHRSYIGDEAQSTTSAKPVACCMRGLSWSVLPWGSSPPCERMISEKSPCLVDSPKHQYRKPVDVREPRGGARFKFGALCERGRRIDR